METVGTLGDSLGSALFFVFSSIINVQALCFGHPDSYLYPPPKKNRGNDVIPVFSGKLSPIYPHFRCSWVFWRREGAMSLSQRQRFEPPVSIILPFKGPGPECLISPESLSFPLEYGIGTYL